MRLCTQQALLVVGEAILITNLVSECTSMSCHAHTHKHCRNGGGSRWSDSERNGLPAGRHCSRHSSRPKARLTLGNPPTSIPTKSTQARGREKKGGRGCVGEIGTSARGDGLGTLKEMDLSLRVARERGLIGHEGDLEGHESKEPLKGIIA